MTLQELVRQGTWAEFAAGTVLLREGGPVSCLIVAERGRIRVYKSAPTGREGTLYVVRPGELCTMSTLGVLRDVPSPADATAEDDPCEPDPSAGHRPYAYAVHAAGATASPTEPSEELGAHSMLGTTARAARMTLALHR